MCFCWVSYLIHLAFMAHIISENMEDKTTFYAKICNLLRMMIFIWTKRCNSDAFKSMRAWLLYSRYWHKMHINIEIECDRFILIFYGLEKLSLGPVQRLLSGRVLVSSGLHQEQIFWTGFELHCREGEQTEKPLERRRQTFPETAAHFL